MKKKEINILNRNVSVTFNMAVQITYEKLTDKPFDVQDMNKAESIMALFYSSIIVADKDTSLTFEQLVNEITQKDINTINNAVIDLMRDWYNIPSTAEKHVKHADEEGEEEKNS